MKLLAIALASLSLLGCEKTSTTSTDKSAEPGVSATSDAGKILSVTLTDPGREPRRPLRLAITKGQRETGVMGMKMSMSIGGAPTTAIPLIKMTMDVVATDAKPGEFRFDFKYTGLEIVDDGSGVADAMRSQLAGVEDITGYAVVTDRGLPKTADITLPPTMTPTMRQMMSGLKDSLKQLASPLPEQPVGEGASWVVNMPVDQNGLSMKQVATYKVTKLDETSFTATLSLVQSALPQRVKMPNLPADTTVDLVSLKSTGSGGLMQSLNHFLPRASNVNLTSATEMKIATGGEKQNMSMKMEMSMTLEAK